MERSEHHTQIQSQTNAHPHYIHPLLRISRKDHIRNEIVCKKIQAAIGPYDKLRWFGYVIRSSGLCKKIVQGTVPGKRTRGRQKKRWEDNIREWTGLDFNSSQRAAEDRQRWQKIVADVSSGAPTTLLVASGTQVTRNRSSRNWRTRVGFCCW